MNFIANLIHSRRKCLGDRSQIVNLLLIFVNLFCNVKFQRDHRYAGPEMIRLQSTSVSGSDVAKKWKYPSPAELRTVWQSQRQPAFDVGKMRDLVGWNQKALSRSTYIFRGRYSISNINQQLTISQQMFKTWCIKFFLQCCLKNWCIHSVHSLPFNLADLNWPRRNIPVLDICEQVYYMM